MAVLRRALHEASARLIANAQKNAHPQQTYSVKDERCYLQFTRGATLLHSFRCALAEYQHIPGN